MKFAANQRRIGGILGLSWQICSSLNLPLAVEMSLENQPPEVASDVARTGKKHFVSRLRPTKPKRPRLEPTRSLEGKSPPSSSFCVSKSQFTNVCTRQLLLDSNSDDLISQNEYAHFVGQMQCFFKNNGYIDPDNGLAFRPLDCTTAHLADSSFTQVEGKVLPPPISSSPSSLSSSLLSFESLPFRLQLSFMRGVCSHLDDKEEDFTNCMSNLADQGYSHERFGFDKNQKQITSDLQSMCLETYDGVSRIGMLSPCTQGVSGTVQVRLSYAVRTHGIDAASLMTGTNPPNELRQGLLQGTLGAVRETLKTRRRRRRLNQPLLQKAQTSDITTETTIKNGTQSASTEEENTIHSSFRSRKQRGHGRKRRHQKLEQYLKNLKEHNMHGMPPTTAKTPRAKGRILASFENSEPVTITAAIDDQCLSPPPQTSDTKCVLVQSTVALHVDAMNDIDQDVAGLKRLVIDGLREKGIQLPENVASDAILV